MGAHFDVCFVFLSRIYLCLLGFCFVFQVLAVQESIEHDLELICLTGVEDKLQVRL